MARFLIAGPDDFNRADGAIGANWQANLNASNAGLVGILSNAVYGQFSFLPGTGGASARWVGAGTFTADQYAKLRLGSAIGGGAGQAGGVICRAGSGVDGARSFYEFVTVGDAASGGNHTTYLNKWVGNTRTALHSATIPWASGDTIELEVTGSGPVTITAYRNGVALGGSWTVVDSTSPITAIGAPGITAGSSGMLLDNWEGGNITAGDAVLPTLTGSMTVGTVTTTSIAVTWPAGSDNVAVTSYEVSSNNGSSYTDTGSTSTGYTFTGLTAGTSYTLRVRAKDAAGNVSTPALSVTQSTAAGGDVTLPILAGSMTVGTVTTTSIAVTWPAGSDNVAVTSYEVSSNNGSSYTDTGSTTLGYTFSGLTAGTSYTLRVRAKDAAGNVSTPALSVTQSTAAADTTVPTLTGTITASAITQTTYTISWPAGSDNVAVTSYETSLDGGSTWSDAGNVLTRNITGRTPGATDQVRVRAKDAAGNVSTPALSTTVTLLSPSTGTVTSEPLRDNAGNLIITTALVYVDVYSVATGAFVMRKTGISTNGSGVFSFSDALVVTGTNYKFDWETSTGKFRMPRKAAA